MLARPRCSVVDPRERGPGCAQIGLRQHMDGGGGRGTGSSTRNVGIGSFLGARSLSTSGQGQPERCGKWSLEAPERGDCAFGKEIAVPRFHPSAHSSRLLLLYMLLLIVFRFHATAHGVLFSYGSLCPLLMLLLMVSRSHSLPCRLTTSTWSPSIRSTSTTKNPSRVSS